jgi:hypothetical protein
VREFNRLTTERRGQVAIRSREDLAHGDLRRSGRSDRLAEEATVTGQDPTELIQVAQVIDRLSALTDVAFAEALADNIMEPDQDETAAFRSRELAHRSLDATKYLLARVNTEFRQRPGESRGSWGKRAAVFRDRVGLERRRLETIIAGLRAERGILMAPPNPRGRAYRELARRHPGEFLVLVREEQEKDRLHAAEEKERRKHVRRAAHFTRRPRAGAQA